LKPITGTELCRKLEQPGWLLKRVRGSHHIFTKAGEKKILTMPV
jgi:predicted RNA binding protein YcfA (HicA-like mRNA interferase family)